MAVVVEEIIKEIIEKAFAKALDGRPFAPRLGKRITASVQQFVQE